MDNPYLAHIYKRKHRGSGQLGSSVIGENLIENSQQDCPHNPVTKKTTLVSPSLQQKPRKTGKIFQFGNYSSYYGKRESSSRLDYRLAAFEKSWFEGLKVLDIGCNSGWMTISIGMAFQPALIEGVDIDPSLIKKSRARLAFCGSTCKLPTELQGLVPHTDYAVDSNENAATKPSTDALIYDFDYYPASCAISFGPLPIVYLDPADTSPFSHQKSFSDNQHKLNTMSDPSRTSIDNSDRVDSNKHSLANPSYTNPTLFPFNVTFRAGDWLNEPPPPSDANRYHTILALSITKWIHLNSGDKGIKRFFQKCYQSLLFGGRLIVEPQNFETYHKRSNLTCTIQKNYSRIKFKPTDFVDYLLGQDVGFSSFFSIDPPSAKSAGFSREIFVFTK
ncbi:hypothetical protein QVD99_001884 [Batrachochytrium dendrobatidis]|nr:hypothetical protein O5D80_000527 [Batrachochytrium dendrobatidis]KAK5672071.1 hypothetical protein QVD99_001884 [Batrachochytrium dendrobatidis]